MMSYQGMVVLAGNQVWWTWEVEDVFRKVKKGDKMGMKNHAKKMHKQISDLVQKVCPHYSNALNHIRVLYLRFLPSLHSDSPNNSPVPIYTPGWRETL